MHALYARYAACLGLVAFGHGNYFAVARLETEAIFARLIGIHFKLGMGLSFVIFNGLILKLGYFCVLAHALKPVHAGGLGSIHL